MSYHFLERKDPRVDVLFQGLDNMERLIAAMEDTPKSVFHGERFLTDEELSKNSEGQQTDIAGIPHTWCCPLLSGTGQGSLQGIGHP